MQLVDCTISLPQIHGQEHLGGGEGGGGGGPKLFA